MTNDQVKAIVLRELELCAKIFLNDTKPDEPGYHYLRTAFQASQSFARGVLYHLDPRAATAIDAELDAICEQWLP